MNEKFKTCFYLFVYFISTYPKRLRRFLTFLFIRNNYSRPLFLLEWLFLFFDLLGIPEILQIIHELVNWKIRSLNPSELSYAYPIFLESIQWRIVRICGNNLICKKYNFAFVSFHTIHFYDRIPDYIMIHELVHVWQYEKYGSAYIVRALHAQSSREGYNYGGITELFNRNHLQDFNFEQMAEIIKDGYLKASSSPIYNNYTKQLQE